MVADDVHLGGTLHRYAVTEVKGKSIAVIDDRTAYGQGVADEFEKGVIAAGGTVVGVVNPLMQEEVVIVNSVSATGAARGSFHWITPIDTDLGCRADLDCSGTVDGADLGLLLGGWGVPGPADLNADGVVDGTDLGALLGAWANCGA